MAVGSCKQPSITDEGSSTEEVGVIEEASLPGLRVGLAFLSSDGSDICPAVPWGQMGGGVGWGSMKNQVGRLGRDAEMPSGQEQKAGGCEGQCGEGAGAMEGQQDIWQEPHLLGAKAEHK